MTDSHSSRETNLSFVGSDVHQSARLHGERRMNLQNGRSLPSICSLASKQEKPSVCERDSPSSVSVAEQDAVPPLLVATQEYSPSSSGYTLEISSWQLSSN